MLTRTSLIALAATAVIAGSGLTPTVAAAGWWQHQFDMHKDRRDIRSDNADIYRDRVDLRIGTFSKSFGTVGGFVCADPRLSKPGSDGGDRGTSVRKHPICGGQARG